MSESQLNNNTVEEAVLTSLERKCLDTYVMEDLAEHKVRSYTRRFEHLFPLYEKLEKKFTLTPIEVDRFKQLFVELLEPYKQSARDEISIPGVCRALGVNAKGKYSTIGKLVLERWKEKNPGKSMRKKIVQTREKLYRRNVYYVEDFALIAKVVLEVVHEN